MEARIKDFVEVQRKKKESKKEVLIVKDYKNDKEISDKV